MTVNEIKMAAYDETKLPQPELPIAERLLWYALRDIYQRFRNGSLTRDQGDRLAIDAVKQYQTDSAQYRLLSRIAENNASTWKNIEMAVYTYQHGKTHSDEINAVIEAIYNCKLKNEEGDA